MFVSQLFDKECWFLKIDKSLMINIRKSKSAFSDKAIYFDKLTKIYIIYF